MSKTIIINSESNPIIRMKYFIRCYIAPKLI